MGQALLKRHPNMSRPEFLAYWEKEHAPKIVPWALKHGVVYYAQVHNIRLSASASTSMPDLNIGEWDGAAELGFGDSDQSEKLAAAVDSYYVNVILPDERRFLVSEAKDHVLAVATGTIEGDRKVIIENGKALIGCEKETAAWREWEGK